jgi:hypothetical protein
VTALYPNLHESGGALQNPGFERGILGWHPRSNQDLPNHVPDTEIAHSGEASGRIDRSGYYYGPRVPVQPGEPIRASAWARTASTTGDGARLAIHFWDASDDCFSVIDTDTVRPEEWTLLEVDTTVPEDAVEAGIGLYYRGDGAGWWDDAMMEVESQAVEIDRPPVGDVSALHGGRRGLTARIGERTLAVITRGDAVEVDGMTVAHDGDFAALSIDDTGWRSCYVQQGSALSIDGETVLDAQADAPVSVAVWRTDERGVIGVRMQQSLEPHAPAMGPDTMRLRVRSDEPIERAVSGDRELPVMREGDLWIIG